MIHPLIPIAHDWWEHEFNAVEHIAHVHDQYGNDHLEKELNKATSENSRNKNQNSLQSDDQVSFHLSQSDCCLNSSINQFNVQHKFFRSGKLLSVFISINIPPPKFS